jgi:SAM-dependent methyltransferase
MRPPSSDTRFGGALPELYERYLVPLIFQPYAIDLAMRTAALSPRRVLEVAAGTGVVTRELATRLRSDVDIVATDLNGPMLEQAARIGTSRPVTWQAADAQQLPFADAAFDVVACQFGVMFFPDKPRAFAEARRVLRPRGTLLFNVWARIEENVFAETVTAAVAGVFPEDPPRFLARTPHGYFDLATIARDLALGGFTQRPRCDTVTAVARVEHPRAAAVAYCEGTPLRNEIEARDPARLGAAIDSAEAALARRFGSGAIAGRIQAHVIQVQRTD